MATFELGIRTTVTTTTAACWELRSASGTPFHLTELGITLGAATASTYGLGRPAAIGITPTSPIVMLPMDPTDSAFTPPSSAVAWGTGPTVPANFFRRIALPAVIGAGIVWTFGDEGLVIGPGNAAAGVASIVLWNITANSAITEIYARGRM